MGDYEATKVAETLDKFRDENPDRHTPGATQAIEEYTRRLVEHGTFTPDAEITADLSLTPKERIMGTRKQNMTGMFALGVVVGSALEQDIPTGGTKEDAWRNGEFELPDEYGDSK